MTIKTSIKLMTRRGLLILRSAPSPSNRQAMLLFRIVRYPDILSFGGELSFEIREA